MDPKEFYPLFRLLLSQRVPRTMDFGDGSDDSTLKTALVFTNSAALEHLEGTATYRALALAPDQMEGLQQLLFLNCDSGWFTHVSLLNATDPFEEIGPHIYEPNICSVLPLMDPIPVDTEILSNQLQSIKGGGPVLHYETVVIDDVDFIAGTDDNETEEMTLWLASEITDSLILSRRSIYHQFAMWWLKGHYHKQFSLDRERSAPTVGIFSAISELPPNWVKATTDDNRQGVLFLLNSLASCASAEARRDRR